MDIDTIVDNIKTRGYWRINFRPALYPVDLLPLGDCFELVRCKAVSLRGWDYPHVPTRNDEGEGKSASDHFYHAWVNWNGYKEYWRMYQSGQFLHYISLREDWDDENGFLMGTGLNEPGEIIDIDGSVLYQLTEVYEFISRFVTADIYDNGIFISIALCNTKNRELYIGNRSKAPFHNSYKSDIDIIEFSSEYGKEQIIEKPDYFALEAALYFFDRFAWHKPPLETLRQDQAQLLAGN